MLVGLVARTHGLRGEVLVNLETDFPEQRFRVGARLQARTDAGVEPVVIASVRYHQGRPLLGLEEAGSIDEVERFVGAELFVPETELGPLPEGLYYHHQLLGCAVVTDAGEALGTVASIDGDMATSRLVVRGPRGEVLIPFTPAMCRVDEPARRIVVTPPDGLLEINGDWRQAP